LFTSRLSSSLILL